MTPKQQVGTQKRNLIICFKNPRFMESGGDDETQKDMLSMIVRNVVVNDFIFMIDCISVKNKPFFLFSSSINS